MKGLNASLLAFLAIAAIGLIWQGVVTALQVPAYLLPAPAAIVAAGIHQHATLLAQTWFTLRATAAGLLISLSFAISLAAIFANSGRTERAALPLLIAFRTAPVPAVAPIAMLFLGRGIGTSVLVVVIVSFFPLLVNIKRGLVLVDRSHLEMFQMYDASVWQVFWRLRAPTSLPYFFTALRIAGPTALLGAMLSEWITGSRGLGSLILESADMRETALLWAAVLMAVSVGLVLFWLTALGERVTMRWKG